MRDWLWYLAIWLTVALFFVGLIALGAHGQHDHATMPRWLVTHPDFASCCSERDCRSLMIPPRPIAAGWLVTVAGHAFPPVPYERAKVSGDGMFWACIIPGQDHVRCLFAPPSGV